MRVASNRRRAGYTLMEVMVVVAIIILAASITVPVVSSMIDDARITASSDTVRAQLAETRAKAMDSGKPWRLACMPGTGYYMLAPDDSTEWESTDQSVLQREDAIRDTLDKDIVFSSSPGTGAAAAGNGWQTIAVYTYDGSAREDSIIYFGKTGTPLMAAEVRGLTGSVIMRSAVEVMGMQP